VFVFAVYKCEPVPLGVSNGGLCAIQPHLSPKNSNSEVTTMTTTDKAIRTFGFEDARTITIAFLEEQGKHELAEDLFKTLTDDEEYEDDFDDYDRDYEPDVDECGFDPYEGCYTYDC